MDDCLQEGLHVELKHIAASTNKCPSCVSDEKNGIFLFGSCNAVAVCRTESKNENCNYKTLTQTLNKHTGRVNCVKWIQDTTTLTDSAYFVSGSTDCNVICWKCEFDNNDCIFTVCKVLKGHTGAITALGGMLYENATKEKYILIVSTSVDASVVFWRSPLSSIENELEIFHKIEFGNVLVLSVSLQSLASDSIILACGLDNGNVQLYCMEIQSGAVETASSMITGTNEQTVETEEFKLTETLHGHEDWVRGVDFYPADNGDLLLATCSQDGFIRLWRISSQEEISHDSEELQLKRKTFKVGQIEKTYTVHLESVLSGHEGWVYSVHWMPKSKTHKGPKLLSASMDKSIIIWEVDSETGVWIEKVRFGEVGGNTLGFYGARFNSSGTEIIAHSYNGALHFWEEVKNIKNEIRWQPGVTVCGHFGAVLDIAWEPCHGRFLLTTSVDQTTRLIAPWKYGGGMGESWHEIARPQIHGYDMHCISMMDSLRFISGADEKVLRVFEAPKNFLQNIKNISAATISKDTEAPEGASVPALGLSNKAVFKSHSSETPKSQGEKYIENQFTSVALIKPPTEEHLLQNTLWPETHKLYFHVYEIFCVAANTAGTLVASAAKSATSDLAGIALWCTKTWKKVALLEGHTLTVTQMQFSNNGKYLLSVSRDRTWNMHHITESDSEYCVKVFAKSDKKTCHTRIIWSCSWTHDDNIFGTCSRDKKVMFWGVNDDETAGDKQVSRLFVMDAAESTTAIAFAPKLIEPQKYLFCVGKESGVLEMHLFSSLPEQYSCSLLYRFDVNHSHGSTVKRLQWRPKEGCINDNDFWIASCGMDNIVKLFRLTLR